MRLIDTTTLEVKEFIGEPSDPDFPRYAILSHTWGQEEVSFHDIQNLELARQKQGFAKIAKCCEKALEEGLRWAWVDTCCIDKTSSAELSEGQCLCLFEVTSDIADLLGAINSMFKWYEAATICYAFLSDFDPGPWVEWTTSNWFRRGWTLQELIAPYEVVFYFRTWKEIGSKRHFSEQLARTTRISQGILLHQEAMQEIPVATRMLWAKGRNTTRREDKAYCLFGILDVNMPLLYGEGGKAFSRLHEMILKSTDDDTLFLGSLTGDDQSSLDSRHLFDVPSIMITPEDVGTDVVYASYSAERSPKNPEIRTGTLSTRMYLREVALESARIHPEGTQLVCLDLNHIDRRLAHYMAQLERFRIICLGLLECKMGDQYVARYFVTSSTSPVLSLIPLCIYRLIPPDEAVGWSFLKCTIELVNRSPRSPSALMPLRCCEMCRPASTQRSNDRGNSRVKCGNGWAWTQTSSICDQLVGIDTIELNFYRFQPTSVAGANVMGLAIYKGSSTFLIALQGLPSDDHFTMEDFENGFKRTISYFGWRSADSMIQALSGAGEPPEIAYKEFRHGPVVEVSLRVPVTGGFADMVVSIHRGSDDAGVVTFSPMVRFRAFSSSGSARDGGSTTDVSPPTIDEDHKREGVS